MLVLSDEQRQEQPRDAGLKRESPLGVLPRPCVRLHARHCAELVAERLLLEARGGFVGLRVKPLLRRRGPCFPRSDRARARPPYHPTRDLDTTGGHQFVGEMMRVVNDAAVGDVVVSVRYFEIVDKTVWTHAAKRAVTAWLEKRKTVHPRPDK